MDAQTRFRPVRERQPGKVGEPAVVARRVVSPHLLPPGEPRELAAADGGLHVGHVGLHAGLEDVVPPAPAGKVATPRVGRHAVQPRPAQPARTLGVVGGDHAALTDGEVLGGVEAEADGRAVPDSSGTVRAPDGVRGVLDHPVEREVRGRSERRNVRGVARPVHDHHRLRAPAPGVRGAGGLGRRHSGDRRDVDQDGSQPGVQDRLHGAAEGQVGDQDRCPLREPQVAERELQRGRARGDRDRVRRTDVRRELGLERRHLGSGRHPAGLQDPVRGASGAGSDVAVREGNPVRSRSRGELGCHVHRR